MLRSLAIITATASLTCLVAGCASGAKVAGTPGPDQEAAMNKLKSLAGEWSKPAEGESPASTIVYSVTSGGSAVREIMFPGTGYKMTNVYHLDGKSVVCTHYCAMGNQPRMRAESLSSDGKSIAFGFDSVTNLSKSDEHYMGGLRLDMPDNDHLIQTWTSLENGKPVDKPTTFKFTRKK